MQDTQQNEETDLAQVLRLLEKKAARLRTSERDLRFLPYVLEAQALSITVDALIVNEFPCDFVWSPVITPHFYASCLFEGFLPLGATLNKYPSKDDSNYLLLKLHQERCVLKPEDVHVSKSTKRRAKPFSISINRAFSQVLDYISAQHGASCWITPKLKQIYMEIHSNPSRYSVSLNSIEIWRKDILVAGEIGCQVAACFTSLSGFHRESASGSVQLACLGKVLKTHGILLWDMGMTLDYKIDLGAKEIPRRTFIKLFRACRDRIVPPLTLSYSETVEGKHHTHILDCSTILKELEEKKNKIK